MSQRTDGGPVAVRIDLVYGDSMRLWMTADDGVLTLRTPSTLLSTLQLAQIRAVVLPELPYSFVLSDDSGGEADVFCTFADTPQRNGWLVYLQKLGVQVVNRRGRLLRRRRRVEFAD
jgi:hypothetical protein